MAKVRVNWGQIAADCSVKLFEVWNTSHKSLYVLARDERTAMSIARTANHIYGTDTILALDYSRRVEEVKFPLGSDMAKHWDSIQAAVANRVQGTVHFKDDHITVGDEAFVR